jgi:lipopolysaccharide biosynthesis glycosyltransferase
VPKVLNNTIHIAASCDDNYAQHVGVAFQSLLSNTKTPQNISLHLISDNISVNNQEKLKSIAQNFKARIEIIRSTNEQFTDLPTSRYGTAAYQRIALASYLSPDINKVIYLDSDTLVLDDIIHLWEIDLQGRGLAAVENFSPKACQDLGFDRKGYFNSGVLLIDLDYWRSHHILAKTVSLIKDNVQKIRYFDQCGLNLSFKNGWVKIPPQWNQQGDIYGVIKKYLNGCGYTKAQLQNAVNKPGIVHFIGTQKPWLLNCFHPFKKTYQYYLHQTPWEKETYKDSSIINHLKYYFSIRKRLKQYWRMLAVSRSGNKIYI